MISIKVDIIGGGIAGLSTAISLKENDNSIDVVVHEKHKKIGYNHEGRRCGEAHSIDKEWDKWTIQKNCYFNEIRKGIVYIGNKKHVLQTPPKSGYILNRQEFINQLGKKAEKLGTIIELKDKVKTINDLEGDYIVDASGCPSVVKRELKLNKGFKGVSYQQTIQDSNCFISDTLKVYYIEECGYYWIFPRDPEKKEVNVGLGLYKNHRYNLKNMLEEFKQQQDIQGKVNYVTGGLIPLGLQRPFQYNKILFVGDASTGTFPFTGQGIYRALLSGDIAGRCIAHNIVKNYSHMINKSFIKWDLIGKIFLNTNLICKRINPKLVNRNVNIYYTYGIKMLH